MKEDILVSPNGVILDNLDIISKKHELLIDAQISELAEMAREFAQVSLSLMNDGAELSDAFAVISEGLTFFGEGEVRSRRLNLKSRELFCRLFIEFMARGGIKIGEGHFLPEEPCEGSFVYVRNTLSDEAYDVFSQNFDNPTVSYVASFKEACSAVATGDAGYCILPIEELGGARIQSITTMINGYDLKISDITPVFGPLGNADVKYAQISKGFGNLDFDGDDDRYLEARIYSQDGLTLSEILSVAEAYGNSVYRVNTSVEKTEDGTAATSFTVVFKDGGEDFSALLLFLTLFCKDFIPTGLYKNVE